MARKSLADRFKRNLTQVGGQSLSITIPIEYLQELEWTKGMELRVSMNKTKKRVIIEEITE